MLKSSGLHHITAIGGDPGQNLDFYTGVMGLRLVKKTVNYDDPSTYHLFYGDKSGRPGSILSFFCDAGFSEGEPDIGQAIAVSFAVPVSALDFWVDHLGDKGIDFVDPFERFGKPVIGLQDPDGLHLEIVGDSTVENVEGWSSNTIPAEHSIRGLHGITLAEANYRATAQLLQESLGFEENAEEHGRFLYEADARTSVELIDGVELDGAAGKGTVHHIAFRAQDKEHQQQLGKQLEDVGYLLTEVEDRQYFSSFFFYEPGGVLVEVATDGPGFTVDEEPDSLGSNLCLPPSLEDKRRLIEVELPDLIFNSR